MRRIFRFCARWRFGLAGAALLALIAGWAAFLRTPLTTDVAELLPDRGNQALADFRLLAKAPLARRIVLRLRDEGAAGQGRLLAVANKLAGRLRGPFFSRVVSGPEGEGSALLTFALEQWPDLMRPQDYDSIRQRLTAGSVAAALRDVYDKLLQPTGFLQKKMLLADPLNFRKLIFPRLLSLNPLAEARVVDGHFLSVDGRETLLLLETPVSITDYKGSKELAAELKRIIKEVVPAGIQTLILSGHLYTKANAAAIQRDMVVVLGASLLALLLIFLAFMRERRALLVFLLPVAILGPALGLTGLVEGSISAITIGFGAVLMGVTIDYGLHLYFGLKDSGRPPEEVVKTLAPPLLAAALTTVGAFSVQLFSVLPGQRQLALFAIFGILLAIIPALLLLPHFLGGRPSMVAGEGELPYRKIHRPRLVLLSWVLAMLFLALMALRINCVGDLRQVNLVPESLRAAENSLKSVWGEVRGRALGFARGDTLEEALQVNEKLYPLLRQQFSAREIVSLAPILPSAKTQERRRKAWRLFWNPQRLNELQLNLERAGREIGFAAPAFTPFVKSLSQLPPQLSLDFWRRAGFAALFAALIDCGGSGVTVISLLPDRLNADLMEKCNAVTGVRLVSPKLFNQEVSAAISADLLRFISLALIVVSLILLFLLRNLYQAGLALLPVLAGLLSMFGIMGLCGLSFNIFNLVAAILLIGLGVDYGIFMVYRLFRGSDQAVEKAVMVSALTTLAGFGVLVLARHPALNSIGLTVLLGVGGALPTVLWVLPALAEIGKRE